MILAFNAPAFKDKILKREKIHSIRIDKGSRWKKGSKIHFWMGSPFRKEMQPHQFGEAEACEASFVLLNFQHDYVEAIGSYYYGNDEIDPEAFARNDGFESWAELKEYFKGEDFAGTLIVWNGFRPACYVPKPPKPPKPPKEPKPPKRYKSWRKLQIAIPFDYGN